MYKETQLEMNGYTIHQVQETQAQTQLAVESLQIRPVPTLSFLLAGNLSMGFSAITNDCEKSSLAMHKWISYVQSKYFAHQFEWSANGTVWIVWSNNRISMTEKLGLKSQGQCDPTTELL